MRINTGTRTVRDMMLHPQATKNYDGNLAFKMSKKVELYTRVATCFWQEPKFYGEVAAQTKELLKLMEEVANEDPEWVFKLAAYCRQVLNLRTVSVVLFVVASNSESARICNSREPNILPARLSRKYAPHIICRADEITEALAFQIKYKGSKKAMPNNLRRALGDVFNHFSAYSLSKYNRDGEVKLKDALRMVHPKPGNEEKSKLFKSILNDTIKPADTWEVTLSNWKSLGFETKKDAWNTIQKKMGYMATLRNLRNFLDENCNMAPILEKITDKYEVIKSKQLPFRFYSAYRMIEDNSNPFTGATLTAVSKAMNYAVDNVPDLPGVTVIAIDHSGSMNDSTISDKSNITYKDAADALAAIARAKSRLCVLMDYADNAYFINVAQSDVMSALKEIKVKSTCGGTNTEDVFNKLMEKKVRADRIIVISDEQDNEGFASRGWMNYRKMFPEARLYAVQIGGYGTSQFVPERGAIELSGFSEKIFQFISLAEQDFDAMVKEIDKYDFIEKKKPEIKEED